ncbi:MAG: hypothetical protein Q7J38_03555 [Gallionella sp.]|nr:hypothetical protein [Gallionella sp.]
MSGTSDDDTIHGGKGDDNIDGSGGSDHLYGDAGDDMFTFGDVSGNSTVDGGGGNWTDTIEIDLGGGPSSGGWTVEIDGEHGTDESGNIVGDNMSGSITTADGTIDFTNIDRIEW